MIKNKKAQLMSLDVLFTVVLFILMFFLLFNVIEAKTYQRNIDVINAELDSVGNLALTRMISNPLVNCYAYDSDNRYSIPGCLSSSSEITKRHLGIPDGYSCSVSVVSVGSFTTNECDSLLNVNNNNYYDINFTVSFLGSLSVTKKDYIESYKGSGSTLNNLQTINLKVWKE